MKVKFYGTGYADLVQDVVLADTGHDVCCVDVDSVKIESLKNGIMPICEPGHSSFVKGNFAAGRVHFTTDAQFGVNFGQLQFIAVGTPLDNDGSADLKYVLKVAETIVTHMIPPKVIIKESTVPVETTGKVAENVRSMLNELGKEQIAFTVVSNPEFLKEGSAIGVCKRPDLIIIVADSNTAEELMRELYAPLNRKHEKIIVMDVKSAELTKYAANCMLGTKISFMNEMVLNGASALVIYTEWQNFKTPDFNVIKTSIMETTIFDGRNLFELSQMKAKGFSYWSIGQLASKVL